MWKLIAEQWNKTHTCRVLLTYKTKDAAYKTARELSQCGYECRITGRDGQTLFV